MERKSICNKLRGESTCDDCENCEVWTEQLEPIFNEIRADERANTVQYIIDEFNRRTVCLGRANAKTYVVNTLNEIWIEVWCRALGAQTTKEKKNEI